ncbi:MAG: MBL fold metallo-hydrolase [Conexivisphaera sp.]
MKIADGIYAIDGTNAHVYVIDTGSGVLQVDSAMRGQFGRIRSFYSSVGLRPNAVAVTHSHMDHVGELASVVKAYGSKAYAHPEEIPVIEGRRPAYTRSALVRILGSIVRPRPVAGVLDIHSLALPGIGVLETPGHTPGSVTLVYERGGERYLFVGDAAFERGGRLEVNSRYSLDVEMAARSLEVIRSMSPALVLPGHGRPVRI